MQKWESQLKEILIREKRIENYLIRDIMLG